MAAHQVWGALFALRPPDFLSLAGSRPQNVPPDFLERALTRARQDGARVAVDANGEELRRLARSELERLVGRVLPAGEDVSAACREVLALGAGAVALSLGEQGPCW
ncbi:hypothetical protein [Deinococcus aestuarii]|uniref:hypothetical protein n=1 Tax=Deinococcus aestuarii TaxID=2774531 RepID=UPI001C0D99FC|nr:hypothetical protein [Deinococcus aestuarii]